MLTYRLLIRVDADLVNAVKIDRVVSVSECDGDEIFADAEGIEICRVRADIIENREVI